MYKLNRVDKESIKVMRENYYKTVVAPMDDMWELGIIGNGNFYTIQDNDIIGYFVVDNKNSLLQFFLEDEHLIHSDIVFEFIKKSMEISHAFVSTYEPRYLSLCLGNNLGVEINAKLYTELIPVEFEKPIEYMTSELAEIKILDEIILYHTDKVNIEVEGLAEYLKMIISYDGLTLFRLNDEIIGTGEIRPSGSSKSYANIGMTVSKNYRKKGVGSYIVYQMRVLANKKGLKAICGTSIENVESQLTIGKSGFYPYHRVLSVKLG